MKKIVTLIGTRPQIIKSAALSRAIKSSFADKLSEVIVNTGQHYDGAMSQVFIDELMPNAPAYNLSVGAVSGVAQIALMMQKLEEVLLIEKPDALVVYGDTNSTLAGAITASKLKIPVAHIEAGLRSFNKEMPEEVNRVLCDNVSTLLFTPTQTATNNLLKEQLVNNPDITTSIDNPLIVQCGDVMLDNNLYFSSTLSDGKILTTLKLEENKFILVTIHRELNVDNEERLSRLFESLLYIVDTYGVKMVFPMHPRTVKMAKLFFSDTFYVRLLDHPLINIIEPVSYLEMLALQKNCNLVMTDSGGIQKEAAFLEKNSIVFRAETEWSELVSTGVTRLVDTDLNKIVKAFEHYYNTPKGDFPKVFGSGNAAAAIGACIYEFIQSK